MNTEKSNDALDRKLEALYIQRKSSIQSPQVVINDLPNKKAHRVNGVFSMLMVGAVTSFGILAVIHHFSHLPEDNVSSFDDGMSYTKQIEVERFDEKNQDIHIHQPTKVFKDKNKLTAQPARYFEASTSINVKPHAAKALTLDSLAIKKIALVLKTEQHITQPTFKVMPELKGVLVSDKTGNIKLSYKVTEEGRVESITITESHVHKKIERAVKEALAQWRYALPVSNKEKLHVEFQFTSE